MADPELEAARIERLKRSAIGMEILAYHAGIPLDKEHSAFLHREPGELEIRYDNRPPAADSASGESVTQGVNPITVRKVMPKHCEVANTHGIYQGALVFVDKCASANLVSLHLVSSLKLPLQPTSPRQFATVQGRFWANELVELNWKGRKKDATSNFYVLPDTSPMMGLIVGIDFIQHYGEDAFTDVEDAEPIYVTAVTKASAKEKEQQAALKTSADQQAQMLEEKRKEAQKQKSISKKDSKQ